MDNKNLTAVEWLEEALAENLKQIIVKSDTALMESLFVKAKAMEKEQIINSFGIGCQVESTRLIGYQDMAQQYYSETYEK